MDQNAVTRKLVKQFIADILNRGDMDVIPTTCARKICFDGFIGSSVGDNALKRIVTSYQSCLKDFHCEIQSVVVERNKAFCLLQFIGRNPTGQQVLWMGAMEFTVTDGLIVKVLEVSDRCYLNLIEIEMKEVVENELRKKSSNRDILMCKVRLDFRLYLTCFITFCS
jgi:hypothetical protein